VTALIGGGHVAYGEASKSGLKTGKFDTIFD
jgi:hypothetical protein